MDNPIVFENVSKYYQQKIALQNVTINFPVNVTTAVIGPSGCGKSTLLQLINGLLRPECGKVFVFSEPLDYENLPAIRKRIGYAVQGIGLFPHLTVEKNISLLARLEKWDEERIHQRTRELMNLVNLPFLYAQKYPHELSGGEQQRVGLCRAMMLDPKIFLLDEPFGALDPITRSDIHNEFLKLQQIAPRTVMLVTHDLREALKLAEFIIILKGGKVEQIGASREILENPATEFVQSFVHLQLEELKVANQQKSRSHSPTNPLK
jgi:osmoprotectant transport system ATP-binding protein